ncbi:MAG: peptidylprolyl isomerase [candidate division KSB1 bacterium]|nr:peptidylprolyl isomerase [candidate division KSB1 bacterium]
MKFIINGEEISEKVFAAELKNQRCIHPNASPEQLSALTKETIIDWTIIRQEAQKSGITVPPALVENELNRLIEEAGGEKRFLQRHGLKKEELAQVRKEIEINLCMRQFLARLTAGLPEPTEEEIAAYYRRHSEEFTDPPWVHAAQILMRPNPARPQVAFQEMVELRKRLLKGESFAALADEYSSCEEPGGDLGRIMPGKMVPEFDAVVFSMEVGEISPVFLTSFGYHLVTVLKRGEARLKSLAEVRNEIIDRIKTERGDEYIASWVDQKKKSARISFEA